MSAVHLWGGLDGKDEDRLPFRFAYVVEEHGFVSRALLQEAVEREVNKVRLALNADPWQRWRLQRIWEVECDGRKELRASVCSARRGVVGDLELIWPKAEDMEAAS